MAKPKIKSIDARDQIQVAHRLVPVIAKLSDISKRALSGDLNISDDTTLTHCMWEIVQVGGNLEDALREESEVDWHALASAVDEEYQKLYE